MSRSRIRESGMVERINRDPSGVEPKKEWIAYLESIGEHLEAGAWRWIVDHNKYPVYREVGSAAGEGWHWFAVDLPFLTSSRRPMNCQLDMVGKWSAPAFKTPFDAFQALVSRLVAEKDKFGLSDKSVENTNQTEQVQTDSKPISDDRSIQLMKQIKSTEMVLGDAEKRMREWMEAIEGKQEQAEQQPKPEKKSKPNPIQYYREIVERGADCEELGDCVVHYDLEFCKRELTRLERIEKWKEGTLTFIDSVSRAKSKLASGLALVWGFVVFSAEIFLKCLLLLVVLALLSGIFTFGAIGISDFLNQILR